MGRNRRHALPQMRLHSASGHARVRISGTEHSLGPFGSPEAQAAYDRLIAGFLASRLGPQQEAAVGPKATVAGTAEPPHGDPTSAEPTPEPLSPTPEPVSEELTVAELCVIFMDHAQNYYQLADGRLSSSYHGMLQAVNAHARPPRAASPGSEVELRTPSAARGCLPQNRLVQLGVRQESL